MYKKNKEKIFITLLLVLSIVIPQVIFASAISMRSSTSTIEPGKTFTVSLYVNPKSVASYTAQANIKFPADLVSVESFTYTSSWIKIELSGYDAIDNTSGILIKTAGYPNGFSTETLMGTLVLKVKKAGAITLTTNKESYVLDVDSNNTLNTYGSFSITAAAPVVVPVVKTTVTPTTTKTTTTKTTTKPAVTTTKTQEVTTPDTVNTEVTGTSIETPAEVKDVPQEKSTSRKWVLIVGAIIVAISAYLGFH